LGWLQNKAPEPPRPPTGHDRYARSYTDILCGPIFEDLPANYQEKAVILCNAEETFRLFYKMVEDIPDVEGN